ncbi:serine hydroxymethyltransferase [bacterium]|nr:serine hydroxymethyltransferase [bacterium]
MENIKNIAPEVYELIQKEIKRQEETLNLIPSENYVSPAVLEATASVFTNKYVEGYPGKRYYPGCQFADQLEILCSQKAKEVFNLDENWKVHPQPLSGSPANLAIYFGLLEPGEKILSMELTHGGHLSHGYKVHISSKFWSAIHYRVNKNGFIDYDEIEEIAQREKPKIIISGATAYPRIIDFKRFGEIAKRVGAYHLADVSHIAGLIAAGIHPSPFEYADVVMTTTHKTLRGPRSAIIFVRKEIYDKIRRAVFPGIQGGSHQHIICAKTVAFFEALKPEFKEYQKQIVKNAKVLADELIKYGFNLLSGGTDNHLILINLRGVIDASLAEGLLEKANILANRNSVPGDESPFKPTGLRLGTPAVTSRGMKENEMKLIAQWIYRILIKKEDSEEIKYKVIDLCKKFPIYKK